MKIATRIASIAFALSASAAVHAHNVWLLPSSTVLSKGDWITVDAAVSNDLFFFNHRPMGLDNLVVTAPDGSTIKPENIHEGKLRSVFDLNLVQPGTYRVAVLNGGVFARWKDKATGQVKRARGTPENITSQIPADAQEVEVTQSAGRIETFVTVGKPSALKPSGKGLELIAANPTDLVKGEKAGFALQIDGQPAKNFDVTITQGNTRYRDKINETTVRTDANGQFSVTWPEAGMYWLEATGKDTKTSVPAAKERRLSYAATLEVMP
ncbi:DUF4198 domain-containing protein [Variovorax sp. YR216]|uniref:DUF4198 domain-containing protein n=2 Tax=Pseudomonadota TaxID=1224 RepID=UPI000898C0CE|nr:DUF4198 domain-containing protein [Variovorax sp. YR216]SEB19103.1 Uncharacterized conserved protein, contains GH25 family domain [Variovorax sp. YR216]